MGQSTCRRFPVAPTKAAFLEYVQVLLDEYGASREAATLAVNGGILDEAATTRQEAALTPADRAQLFRLLATTQHPVYGHEAEGLLRKAEMLTGDGQTTKIKKSLIFVRDVPTLIGGNRNIQNGGDGDGVRPCALSPCRLSWAV